MSLPGGEATTASEGLRLSEEDLKRIAEAVANIIGHGARATPVQSGAPEARSGESSSSRVTGNDARTLRQTDHARTVCVSSENEKKEAAATRRLP